MLMVYDSVINSHEIKSRVVYSNLFGHLLLAYPMVVAQLVDDLLSAVLSLEEVNLIDS